LPALTRRKHGRFTSHDTFRAAQITQARGAFFRLCFSSNRTRLLRSRDAAWPPAKLASVGGCMDSISHDEALHST
jgi:hypothetical protein